MTIEALASGSKGNAYMVSDGETRVLIECGVPIGKLRQLTGFKLSKMQGVLVSHRHEDHCRALLGCISAGVDAYAPQDVFDHKGARGSRCRPAEPLKPFRVGTFSALPFECHHDCECYGYLLHSMATGERLWYFTDTYMVTERFEGVTHIMAECNYSAAALDESVSMGWFPAELKERVARTHMSIDNLLKLLAANDLSQVKEIHLIHMSESNSRAESFKAAVESQTGKPTFAHYGTHL